MESSNSKLLNHPLAYLTAGISVGLALGFLLRGAFNRTVLRRMRLPRETVEEELSEANVNVECKLVLVIRNDLKMGRGKACAQCSHASVLAYQQARKEKEILALWKLSGQRKVVVKVDSEDELLRITANARQAGLITSLVRDAGHTQVMAGTKTVVGVGPAPSNLVDKVTGHLKLY